MVAKRKRKKRVGLSASEESRLRNNLRGQDLLGVTEKGEPIARLKRPSKKFPHLAPSESWVDEQIFSAEDHDRDGNRIIYRFHRPKAFPVPGMIKCEICERMTPTRGQSKVCGDCINEAFEERYAKFRQECRDAGIRL